MGKTVRRKEGEEGKEVGLGCGKAVECVALAGCEEHRTGI